MARAQVPFFALNAGEVGPTALTRVDLEKMRLGAETMLNFMPNVLGPMEIRPGLKYLSSTYADTRTRLVPFIFSADTTSLLEISASGMRVRNSDALVTYVNNSSSNGNPTLAGVAATYTRSGTTVTVNKTAHGLTAGQGVYLGSTGSLGDGWFIIATAAANSFTVTTTASGAISSTACYYYSGWFDASDSGATTFCANGTNGYCGFQSSQYARARLRQTFAVAGGDTAKMHCLKISVIRGQLTFRLGSTVGGTEIISDQLLDPGTHFIAFTPSTTSVYAEFEASSSTGAISYLDGCEIYKNADMLVPTPWAESDLYKVRFAQSGSVVFCACEGYAPMKIERRGANSWGVTKYETSSGPYRNYAGNNVRLKSSGYAGSVTITSDQPFFNAGMVGSVFQMTHPVQVPFATFTGQGQHSEAIRVTGVNTTDRQFSLTIDWGTVTAGTLILERAFGTPEGWTTYKTYIYGAFPPGSVAIDDSQSSTGPPQVASSNGLVVYYRVRTDTTVPFTGLANITLYYEGGSQTGAFRVFSYISPTQVSADCIVPFSSVDYTDDWREGSWSSYRGWPSSVALHDGRLWWAGLDKVYGSVSDDYYNFDPDTEGDSGPIVRSVATGPVEGITWMLPLQRLMVGTASAEISIRSSSFDEPLTPTAFTARNASTIGCAKVQALAIDSGGVFVQRNRSKVFELVFDGEAGDYGSRDLTRLNQDICKPGVTQMAVQRQPDTRVWFVTDYGTVSILLYDRGDNVVGWSRMITDGLVESIAVLPTGDKDDVYFVVNRTINGSTKRYVEKFSTSSSDDRYLCDASYNWTSGSPTTSVTGLNHLAGKTVVAFSPSAGGFAVAPQTYTVSAGGTFTLSSPQTNLIIGLYYAAQFKSVKLAYASTAGTALTQKKRVDHLGIVGVNVAPDGIRIGRDLTNLTSLAPLYKGKQPAAGTVFPAWDYDATSFAGQFDSDSRVCIQVMAPYPATISGFVINMQTNDRG